MHRVGLRGPGALAIPTLCKQIVHSSGGFLLLPQSRFGCQHWDLSDGMNILVGP